MSEARISFPMVIAGFGVAFFLFAAVLIDSRAVHAGPLARGETHLGTISGTIVQTSPGSLPHQPAALQADDEIAVLRAIDVALTQASDGATYVWRRDGGQLAGSVRMTSTFRDVSGRICRHMELRLISAGFSRSTEGIACRQKDGVWDLEG
ncbi:MAG: hypothetical protein AB7G35_02060 [Hyphomicrobiaceae bacterium]